MQSAAPFPFRAAAAALAPCFALCCCAVPVPASRVAAQTAGEVATEPAPTSKLAAIRLPGKAERTLAQRARYELLAHVEKAAALGVPLSSSPSALEVVGWDFEKGGSAAETSDAVTVALSSVPAPARTSSAVEATFSRATRKGGPDLLGYWVGAGTGLLLCWGKPNTASEPAAEKDSGIPSAILGKWTRSDSTRTLHGPTTENRRTVGAGMTGLQTYQFRADGTYEFWSSLRSNVGYSSNEYFTYEKGTALVNGAGSF